jgi:protoporphyrinogen oxidase
MQLGQKRSFILGGGITGLSAGMSSGLPVFEAATDPGGICSSYYVRPGDTVRLTQAPSDEEAYRFEIGGGHWIFGGDPTVLRFVQSLVPVKTYNRSSSVYFANQDLYTPYPLQNHLRYLEPSIVVKALKELAEPCGQGETMAAWLESSFGPTLCDLFFYPFHDLYTAGLYKEIEPQDAYKSPVKLDLAIEGAFSEAQAVGYNVTFIYPEDGLNVLAQKMASLSDVRYNRKAVAIDVDKRVVTFDDGHLLGYDSLISTLPLNKMIEMTGLKVDARPDPYTSVLVLNIGATRGKHCPDDHWLYNPDAKSGFHRVGFYSNVDRSFMPRSARQNNDAVSIYVERAYVGGNTAPTEAEIQQYSQDVVEELKSWEFIREAQVVDPTWIEVAYTWSWPKSVWKSQALAALEECGIYQIGRYGRWIFQGIADSIRDGFYAGSSFRIDTVQHPVEARKQPHNGPYVPHLHPAASLRP